jgi:hypothetical protein
MYFFRGENKIRFISSRRQKTKHCMHKKVHPVAQAQSKRVLEVDDHTGASG